MSSSESWSVESWLRIACVLETPTHGTLVTDRTDATTYREWRRGNGGF